NATASTATAGCWCAPTSTSPRARGHTTTRRSTPTSAAGSGSVPDRFVQLEREEALRRLAARRQDVARAGILPGAVPGPAGAGVARGRLLPDVVERAFRVAVALRRRRDGPGRVPGAGGLDRLRVVLRAERHAVDEGVAEAVEVHDVAAAVAAAAAAATTT